MRTRFTSRAAQQLEIALDAIAERSPSGVRNVRGRLQSILTLLEMHPQAGRMTSKPGIRRIPLNPYPYLIDYSTTEDEIIVRRFRHGARRPLP